MNLGTLIVEAQRLAGRVDSNFNERTRRWINEAQSEWAISVPWPTLIHTESFIADGTRKMVLPFRVLSIRTVGDKTNKNYLNVSAYWERESPAQLYGNSTGNAWVFREAGVEAVVRQPATASKLWCNTTASDNFNVFVSGLVQDTTASGTAAEYYYADEEIAITGSGPHSSVNTYVQFEVIGKDDLTPGDLICHDGASNVVARIPAARYRSEYRTIEFLNIPSAGTEIQVSYVRRPSDLNVNAQVPHPSVDTEYLVWYAAALIHAAQGEEDKAQAKRMHAEAVLQRRVYKERMHGQKDLRAIPEYGYWNSEDEYIPAEW